MLQFDQFVSRHGEVAAQALLENLERYQGIRSCTATPLDQRWEVIMQDQTEQRLAA